MKNRNKKNRKSPPEKITGKRSRISKKTGMPPGTLVHIGEVVTDEVQLHQTLYDKENYSITRIGEPGKLSTGSRNQVMWLEVCGLHRVDLIENLGNRLDISPMILEDVLNTEHRPKIDIQEKHIFVTMKHFRIQDNLELCVEQISFVLGEGFLVSFRERPSPLFEEVRERISGGIGKIRQRGPDYLLYALVDVIVDHQYSIAESITDRLDDLEEAVYENPDRELIEKNQMIRKDISSVRKALLPLQDDISKLIREEPDLLDEATARYYTDIQDHIIQILDMLDTCREITNEIRERYLSYLSYRMNQVMKLLTVITTIFIPLSFIAGIYGMNFANMPELSWKYGYFGVLGAMMAIMITMLVYFRRKKWI